MAYRTRGGGGDAFQSLVDSNARMGRDLEALRNRLSALEAGGGAATAAGAGVSVDGDGEDVASDRAATESANMGAPNNTVAARRGIQWQDSLNVLVEGDILAGDGGDAAEVPMKKIKFRTSPTNSPDRLAAAIPDGDNQLQQFEGDDDDSSSSSSSEEAVAFSGWARCFFQARHHRSATQITSGATSTTSQDTYLYLTIHSTSNELRISDTDERFRPPLIDPPIPLRYFYAAKVPGSHSGAALFLRNDPRRLRKYIFRFEFVNRAVHQPPARYVQFVRSGKAMENALRSEGESFGMPLPARHFYLRGRSGGKVWRAALALRTSKPATSGRALQIDGGKSRQIDAPAPELVAVCIGWNAAAEQVESWYKVVPR